MNKNTTLIVSIVLLIAVLLVAVGYAAITAVTLNIGGTAKAEGAQANFTVKFLTSPAPTKEGKGTIEPSVTDDLNAVMNVTGLTAKGDTATATYTIQNTSADLSAALTATTSNSNETFFKVSYEFADGATTATLAHGATTTIKVTVELIKTPIAETEAQLTSTVGVAITASPVQP